MADRTIKPDDTNDLVLSNNHGDGKIEVNENNTIIITSEAVTQPSQPAFLAFCDGTQSNPADNDKVEYDNEIFDQSENYNTTTYTFTAPVTGKYQLSYLVYLTGVDKGNTWMRVPIYTSNRTYLIGFIDPDVFVQDAAHWSCCGSALADMDAGDTAYVYWDFSGGSTCSTIGDTQAFFSGHLVA